MAKLTNKVVTLHLDRSKDREDWERLLSGHWSPPEGWRLIGISTLGYADASLDRVLLAMERLERRGS